MLHGEQTCVYDTADSPLSIVLDQTPCCQCMPSMYFTKSVLVLKSLYLHAVQLSFYWDHWMSDLPSDYSAVCIATSCSNHNLQVSLHPSLVMVQSTWCLISKRYSSFTPSYDSLSFLYPTG